MGQMSLEFTGLDGKPFMKLEPYAGECCFKLSEWATIANKTTGEEKEGWRQVEYYPTSLESALKKIRRTMIMEQGKATADIDKMCKAVHEVARLTKVQ